MHGNTHQFLTDEVTVRESPAIPAGTYDAYLEGVTEEEHDPYGERWVWHWTIQELHPDGSDFHLHVWTPPHLSTTGMATEQAKALGASVATGAKVQLGHLCGQQARLIVTLDEETGRNHVKGVMPAARLFRPAGAAAVDPDCLAWRAKPKSESPERHAPDGGTAPRTSEPSGADA